MEQVSEGFCWGFGFFWGVFSALGVFGLVGFFLAVVIGGLQDRYQRFPDEDQLSSLIALSIATVNAPSLS